ncbi:C45 family peptidase [Candidatus Aminicenantes bacterium AC-708-M15]|jgi:predicted choloylglycine hydrolase|nr:C45 family peptidase [SCandidatus Aminicenantes bacterium Aminicenantia_JdfR_composite]MCP2596945.1 C45 family peptidase [Candidatus Aminicenantes bacterium AC-335-G13]MCP2603977.1 C45 family peptidase [Candidatus Aminicenantes bacterium AC-708-M15]MCP2621073.1 C45 family peptidase [Candidatus Aminicenantes bacterium AC-334-E05]
MKNYKLKKTFFVFLFVLIISSSKAFTCTVAVVSGKATPDGRPLLWKNRDTSELRNKVVYIKGKKYEFIGIVNANDKKAKSIWAGINSEGLAIINAYTPDLMPPGSETTENGKFMRLVLETCATVKDVEKLLVKTNGKRIVASNFGVIDAKGNACFFETGVKNFVKFDANDPRFAPQGFIVRTNYAFTAIPNKGGGYIRFNRAQKLFSQAAGEKRLDYKFILREVSRDLVNEKICSYPLSSQFAQYCGENVYIHTNDTINRYKTACATVFHGVKPGEDPSLSTMWVILGQPVCGVAVPLWVKAKAIPYELSGSNLAPLNLFSLGLALYLYPEQRGNNRQYLNVTRLKNYRGRGVLNILFGIENVVFEKTEKILKKWRNNLPNSKEIFNFEKEICKQVYESLQKNFPMIQIYNER